MPGFAVCVRRCWSLVIVLCILGLMWYIYPRGRKFTTKHDYSSFYREKYSHHQREDLKPNIVYRGTDLKADPLDLGLVRNSQEKEELDQGFRDYAFNVLVSKRLGEVREIPDTRHKTCSDRSYDNELPTASVVICFYNEHPPTLIRSVESVLHRSPETNLHEIILVNDGSSNSFDDVAARVGKEHWQKVRLLHTGRREGLIRARIFGAENATGDVLVFLDSHVECNVGWLQPLLHQIKISHTNVPTPIIDSIDPDTFTYKPSPLVRGGMSWSLNFKWDSLPENYLDKPEKFSSPILSPTMAGGLFAIDRQYFKHLGEYDRGLEIWGGENIELSFRIWMCGGRLEIIPCSRVGHVFRKRRPYSSTNSHGEDTQILNVARVAKVWLGDYIKYFYDSVPSAKHLEVGDLQERFDLKSRLECKDFSWYHQTVYPELGLPGAPTNNTSNKIKFQRWDEKMHDFTDSFQLVHGPTGLCAQPRYGVKHKGGELELKPCMRTKEQTIFQTSKSELLPGGYLCMDASKNVRLQKCTETGGPQSWTLPQESSAEKTAKIYNTAAGLCLGLKELQVTTVICEDDASVWHLKREPVKPKKKLTGRR